MIKYYYKIETYRKDFQTSRYAFFSGDIFWFRNNKIHREDGPAVKWANGIEEWYIDDKYIKREGY